MNRQSFNAQQFGAPGIDKKEPNLKFSTAKITTRSHDPCVMSSMKSFIEPDYLITDSLDMPDEERPTLGQALSNPRDILACAIVFIGTIISIFNVLGIYDNSYLFLESIAIALGFTSSFAYLLQINKEYLISKNVRSGIVDDAAVNLYAAFYTAAVSWLALRTSEICPTFLTMKLLDVALSSGAIAIFIYSLLAPIITLAADDTAVRNNNHIINNNNKNVGGMNVYYKLSQLIVASSRRTVSETNEIELPPLSSTELLRARGLVFIGALGCIFTPDALSFLLGGQEWWGRVSTIHSSQQMLESSTSLFALFATESSMISHRVGKVGVAKYETIVPVFAGVCLVLAIVPCVCALNWLGDGVSFFSFYRE
jgi:hypothetical protein